jgi:uncharacterized protein
MSQELPEVPSAISDALKAQAFDRLLAHFRERTDVQNIQLMDLAGFCRNCLSKWLADAADSRGESLSKEAAKTYVYGMPYEQWKQRFQK